MRELFTENVLVRRTEPPPRVVASTDGLGWSSIQSVLLQELPHHDVYEGTPHLWLSTVPDGPTDLVSTLLGRTKTGPLAPGSICLNYQHGAATVTLENHVEVNHCYVHTGIVEEVAFELFRGDPHKLELIPVFGIDDLSTSLLLANIRHAMTMPDGPAGQLYSDYLARALAAHVVRSFVTRPELLLPRPSAGRMSWRRADDLTLYMRDHIGCDIGIQELASVARTSPTHFARLFRATFNCTPHQYLTRLRLRRAKELLATTNLPVGQVGAACGFPDHAYFSSLFRRHVGLPPAAYRNARSTR